MIKKLLKLFVLVILCAALYWCLDAVPAMNRSEVLTAELETVKNDFLQNNNFEKMFLSTGLGKRGVLDLAQGDSLDTTLAALLRQAQKEFTPQESYIFFPTTKAEVLKNELGFEHKLVLPKIQTGDVLLTKSTKTLLFRHGHAAIVVDENGTTAESFMIGVPSDTFSLEHWRNYSTLMILRPKEDYQEQAREAAKYAKEYLLSVPYNICTGLIKKDKSDGEVDATQCAHLVWQAYFAAGLDIDSNGGWLVTPKDIANSPLFEVVFSFGFGDDAKW